VFIRAPSLGVEEALVDDENEGFQQKFQESVDSCHLAVRVGPSIGAGCGGIDGGLLIFAYVEALIMLPGGVLPNPPPEKIDEIVAVAVAARATPGW
jgi:hypothetical protein